jgi:hypothetical protein
LIKVPLYGNHNLTTQFNVTWGNNLLHTGGGIWSTGVADPTTNLIWISTGNENASWNKASGIYNYSRNIVALDASTLVPVYYHKFGTHGGDEDFGSGPILYRNSSSGHPMVAALNKDANVYTMNRNNTTGWHELVGGASWGLSLGPEAYDGHALYAEGGRNGCPGGTNFNGTIVAMNTSSGSPSGAGFWTKCVNPPYGLPGKNGATALAGVTVANGLVIDVADRLSGSSGIPGFDPYGNATLEVRDSSTGSVLYNHTFNRSSDGEPILTDGRIFVGLGNDSAKSGWEGQGDMLTGRVAAFGIPLRGTLSGYVSTFTPVPGLGIDGGANLSLNTTITGGMPGYACSWFWGDGHTSTGCPSPGTSKTHTYTDISGTYNGNLTVLDLSGRKAVLTFAFSLEYSNPGGTVKTVFGVLNCAPLNDAPSLTICDSQIAGLNVTTFSYVTGGTAPYTFSWTFGDGTAASTSRRPSHQYASSGTYLVSLVVKDAHLIQASSSIFITVPT